MPDVKNVNRSGGNQVNNLTDNQISDQSAKRVSQSSVRGNQTEFPVGQPTELRQPIDAAKLPADAKILGDTAQAEAIKNLSALGGASATDRLLGLDLRPTMTGALTAPPGNSEFLRHLSPQARRTIMRKMLNKQREKMRRLARYLRDRHDEAEDESSGNNGGEAYEQETFLDVISDPVQLDRGQISRATGELEKTALMLNILDEMLALQDYTISQMGSFSQG